MWLRLLIRNLRFLVLVTGLIVTSLALIAGISVSQSTVVTADKNLEEYWRTAYDILVRPPASRSTVEGRYGLVAANHLSGINGGISFQQYDLINAIPGIETAAPIAMVGYIDWMGETKGFSLTEPGAYFLETTFQANDGITAVRRAERAYYFITPDDEMTVIMNEGFPLLYINVPYQLAETLFQTGILVAGIEPSEEAKLVQLDKAIIDGTYLTDNMPLFPIPYSSFHSSCEDHCPDKEVALPVLINDTTYIDMTMQSTLSHLVLDSEVDSLEDLLARGGVEYLASRPSETIRSEITDSAWIHQNTVEKLKTESTFGASLYGLPASLEYQEIHHPFQEDQLALEIVKPEFVQPDKSCPTCSLVLYRLLVRGDNVEEMIASLALNVGYRTNYIGAFNIEHIPQPADVNRVPLETYFPPESILRYDEQGRPVTHPKELHPTDNQAGYIQSPPLILTTLEAARALRGEKAISAIRVRVALDGCLPERPQNCTLTAANQRKIEAIAIEIQRQTGLDVDIMVGSSPKRVLVHVPGIGYVEEQWIQKEVNLVYIQGIQSGNWLLLATLLVAGGLFTLDLTWADVLSRRRLITLQKALGWRTRTIFMQVIGQVVVTSSSAATIGTLSALVLVQLLNWQTPPAGLLMGLPLVLIMLCITGSFFPAWSASRVPPVVEFQHGGLHYRQRPLGTVSGFSSYAWNELKRRSVRSILTGGVSALAAGLLVVLLGTTFQQQGMLGGTLLGEFILVEVEPFHYAIVVIGFGLAALSTFNGLLSSILERRREIGILKAMGWRTVFIARLFILQGLFLGMAGGSVGALMGLFIYLYLYQSISFELVLAILLGMSLPGLVGALAAIYPAWFAARVLPAEAVRYE